jgi:hypothetical protein
MMTLDAGRMRTWRLPRFSAEVIERRASFKTDARTILLECSVVDGGTRKEKKKKKKKKRFFFVGV